MAATLTKHNFSGSASGRPISITSTNTGAPTAIHTVPASVTDEIWLYVTNTHASDNVVLTLLWGSTTATDFIYISVPPRTGLVLVIPGVPLPAAGIVNAAASVSATLSILGYVNRITP